MTPYLDAATRLLGDALPAEQLSAAMADARLDANSDLGAIERALKGLVYRRLQVVMPARDAKARIQRTLSALAKLAPETLADKQPSPPSEASDAEEASEPAPARTTGQLPLLLEGLRRFNLYFDWPEVQKLRSQVHVIREHLAEGQAVASLLREARLQLDGLERKLNGYLSAQAGEVQVLREGLEEVRSSGGPRVRRLELLVAQVTEAQRSGTLAPAEVDRARRIIADLRGATAPSPDAASAVQLEPAIGTPATPEQAEGGAAEEKRLEEARRLHALQSSHEPLLERDEVLAGAVRALREASASGMAISAGLDQVEKSLAASLARVIAEQRAALGDLSTRIDTVSADLDVEEARLRLRVTEGFLTTGTPAWDDLGALEDLVSAMERHAHDRRESAAAEAERASRAVERQRLLLAEARQARAHLAGLDQALLTDLDALLNELAEATAEGEARDDLAALVVEEGQRLANLEGISRESERSRAEPELRALRLALANLPDVEEASAAQASARERLAAAESDPTPDAVAAVAEALAKAQQAARAGLEARLERLTAQAREARQGQLEAQIGAARAALQAGEWPSVVAIEQAVSEARYARLADQARELEELEALTRPLDASPATVGLMAGIASARQAQGAGRLVDVTGLWTALDEIRAAEDASNAAWQARIEALRGAAAEAATEVGPTALKLTSLSAALLAELELSPAGLQTRERLGVRLLEAEGVMAAWTAEQATARELARALSNSASIDDLLGVFSLGESAPASPREDAAADHRVEPDTGTLRAASRAALDSLDRRVRDWVFALAAEPGVGRVAILGHSGEVLAGAVEEPERLAALLLNWQGATGELGSELALGRPRLGTIDLASRTMISLVLATKAGKAFLVVVVSDAPLAARLLAQIRGDAERLSEWSLSPNR